MKKAIIFLALLPVRIYQYLISPWLGANCRFEPSCSHYAVEAIKVWGPWRGWLMAIKRISRCHPWGNFGPDPVPPKEVKP